MQGIGTRVAYIANLVGGKRALANLIGVHETQLYRYIKEENIPAVDIVAGMAKAGKVSMDWLATGEGPMRKGESSMQEQPGGGLPARRLDDKYAYIPLYDVRAAAGQGAPAEGEQVIDVLAFKRDWLRSELHAAPDDLRLIYVDGEGMEPTLRPGDIVLLDKKGAAAQRDGVYVLRLDGALLVKRLQRLPGGLIKATSDHTAYESFTIDLNSLDNIGLAIIGRVVWVGRRM